MHSIALRPSGNSRFPGGTQRGRTLRGGSRARDPLTPYRPGQLLTVVIRPTGSLFVPGPAEPSPPCAYRVIVMTAVPGYSVSSSLNVNRSYQALESSRVAVHSGYRKLYGVGVVTLEIENSARPERLSPARRMRAQSRNISRPR